MGWHDARFAPMIWWMEMKMINENMMDDMKMKMNGKMNEMKNGTMKNEDECEDEWNNDWWDGGRWVMNGKMMDDMMVKMVDEKWKWWMIYGWMKMKERT